ARRPVDRRTQGVGVGDIKRFRLDRAASGQEARRVIGELRFIEVDHDDGCAVLGHGFRIGKAEPACGAGHERHVAPYVEQLSLLHNASHARHAVLVARSSSTLSCATGTSPAMSFCREYTLCRTSRERPHTFRARHPGSASEWHRRWRKPEPMSRWSIFARTRWRKRAPACTTSVHTSRHMCPTCPTRRCWRRLPPRSKRDLGLFTLSATMPAYPCWACGSRRYRAPIGIGSSTSTSRG